MVANESEALIVRLEEYFFRSDPFKNCPVCLWHTTLQCNNIVVTGKPFNFCARQHICYSAYMLSPVRLSVCLSVRHTGDSVKNG